jgi:hypothetical protein
MDEQNTEMDLNEKLDRLIEAIEAITAKIDEQQARIDELDSALYDGLIGPANDAIAKNEYDNALSDFRTKYSEKLGPYEGSVKAIEGDDDFDIFKNAFDAYNDGDYDFSPDEYVDKLAMSLADQIDKIKTAVAEKVGVDKDAVEVNVDAHPSEDGKHDVQIDVDNTETSEKPEDNVTEKEHEEVKTEDGEEHTVESEEKTEEGDGEETIEDFEKSLKDEADKDKDRKWLKY